MVTRTIIFILSFVLWVASATDYQVRITSDEPVVKGGTIHFVATAYENGEVSHGTHFKFYWKDNGVPQHRNESNIGNASHSWTVTYEADLYAKGSYIMNVVLDECIFSIDMSCYEVDSARIEFRITETLNGDMRLTQENKTREHEFVSNTSTVMHTIELKETDWKYIQKAPTVLTYWFVDCVYYGITTDLKFPFNYTVADQTHTIEGLIVADFTPLPPTTTVPPSTTTTPTTTTSKPTTTTTTTTSTPKTTPASTTVKPTSAVTNASTVSTPVPSKQVTKVLRKRSTDSNVALDEGNAKKIMTMVNGTLVPYNSSFPYVCNGTHIATDSKNSYGYFSKTIHVKAPISKVNIIGNNWIQHGDLLDLDVQCHGSRNLEYCIEYKIGAYNITGNDTCFKYFPLDECRFPVKRYLPGSKYTVLIFIRNDVSQVTQPVTVTFYEVTTQPQLSVIVVPVAFSLVAVVLIVFGIAYYIQNRSRFVIEVADFNFGQQYSDLEYKTFRERLRDSITNAFTRGPSPSSSEVPVWPPGRKYGSMT